KAAGASGAATADKAAGASGAAAHRRRSGDRDGHGDDRRAGGYAAGRSARQRGADAERAVPLAPGAAVAPVPMPEQGTPSTAQRHIQLRGEAGGRRAVIYDRVQVGYWGARGHEADRRDPGGHVPDDGAAAPLRGKSRPSLRTEEDSGLLPSVHRAGGRRRG